MSSESQEIRLSCYCSVGEESRDIPQHVSSVYRVSFWAQFSRPPFPIVHGSCFGLLSWRQWASPLCKVTPNVPSRHGALRMGLDQLRVAAGTNLFIPVVLVPPREPLQSCTGWSPSMGRAGEMVGDNFPWPGLSALKVTLLPGEDRMCHSGDWKGDLSSWCFEVSPYFLPLGLSSTWGIWPGLATSPIMYHWSLVERASEHCRQLKKCSFLYASSFTFFFLFLF